MSYADYLANEGKRLLWNIEGCVSDSLVVRATHKRISDILTELAQIAHDYDVKLHDVEDELRAEQELRLERNLR